MENKEMVSVCDFEILSDSFIVNTKLGFVTLFLFSTALFSHCYKGNSIYRNHYLSQFLHLWKGNNNNTSHIVLLWELYVWRADNSAWFTMITQEILASIIIITNSSRNTMILIM